MTEAKTPKAKKDEKSEAEQIEDLKLQLDAAQRRYERVREAAAAYEKIVKIVTK